MTWAPTLFTVWLLHLGVAASPGLNFALIGRTAVRHTRRDAMLVVAGIVTAATLWVALATFGLGVLVERAGTAFEVIRLIAAGYLIVIGVHKLTSRGSVPAVDDADRDGTTLTWHYTAGLVTNLGNPKAVLFFSSLFATAFPADTPLGVRLAGAALVLFNSFSVHGALAYVVSDRRLRHHYLRHTRLLDRLFGVAFVGFGLRIAIKR